MSLRVPIVPGELEIILKLLFCISLFLVIFTFLHYFKATPLLNQVLACCVAESTKIREARLIEYVPSE